MKYTVAIETMQLVEIEAETEERAIEIVKSQLDRQVAHFSIVQETIYDEETKTYRINIKE